MQFAKKKFDSDLKDAKKSKNEENIQKILKEYLK